MTGFNMTKRRTSPIRTCIGCRNKFPKEDLIRYVVNEQGQLILDLEQKLPKRGAYLCKRKKCFVLARKRNALKRAFKGRTVRANLLEHWDLIAKETKYGPVLSKQCEQTSNRKPYGRSRV